MQVSASCKGFFNPAMEAECSKSLPSQIQVENTIAWFLGSAAVCTLMSMGIYSSSDCLAAWGNWFGSLVLLHRSVL